MENKPGLLRLIVQTSSDLRMWLMCHFAVTETTIFMIDQDGSWRSPDGTSGNGGFVIYEWAAPKETGQSIQGQRKQLARAKASDQQRRAVV